MQLEKSKEYLIRFNDLVLSWNLKEKCELNDIKDKFGNVV